MRLPLATAGLVAITVVVGAVTQASAMPLAAPSARPTPPIEWKVKSLPRSTSVELSEVVRVGSTGRRSWIAAGACSLKGSRLVTQKRDGVCLLSLKVAATQRHRASTSSTTIRVKKRSELNVHVAASLGRVFTTIGSTFMSTHRDVSLKFNFAGSSTLAMQIRQGAPADIVVMADNESMNKVVADGDVRRSDVVNLATNRLAILVQRGNPSSIRSLRDLERDDLRVVLCDDSQPCGKYAAVVLDSVKAKVDVAGRESSAAAVVTRISLGEADAGIAYVTDGLVTGDKVDFIEIPATNNVVVNYPMARLVRPSSKDTTTIAAFLSMVRGPVGDALLENAGFVVS